MPYEHGSSCRRRRKKTCDTYWCMRGLKYKTEWNRKLTPLSCKRFVFVDVPQEYCLHFVSKVRVISHLLGHLFKQPCTRYHTLCCTWNTTARRGRWFLVDNVNIASCNTRILCNTSYYFNSFTYYHPISLFPASMTMIYMFQGDPVHGYLTPYGTTIFTHHVQFIL